MMTKKPKSPKPITNSKAREAAPVTFLEHTKELQVRLFIVLIAFLLIAGAAWPFFDVIANVLTRPLGENHELFYLTPGGAFTFIMQVCIYVGLIGALPVIIYQVYRFVMPAVKKTTFWKAVGFTIISLLLALGGIAFGYIVLLPAALEFLTGFSFNEINPMLTIDSYMSFVMTYLLASALLFQLPLIMIIIDSINPQTPGGLMKQQGKILLGSFIVAAIISPTPDALNQTILASPIVVMYQIGIMVIWVRHRKRVRLARKAIALSAATDQKSPAIVQQPAPVTGQSPLIPEIAQPASKVNRPIDMVRFSGITQSSRQRPQDRGRITPQPRSSLQPRSAYSVDGMRREGSTILRPMSSHRTLDQTAIRSQPRRVAQTSTPIARTRLPTIDGFVQSA